MNPSAADHTPAQWDALLNTTNTPEGLMPQLLPMESTLAARRFLACAVASLDRDVITNALAQIEVLYPGLKCGVRLIALGQLGQPEAIRAAAPLVRDTTAPTDLEDGCDEALARGIAAASLQAYDEAHGQLSVALFLARALGMRHREQHVMLELGRVLTVQGRPDPEMIEQALVMPIQTSTRRREYGADSLAEACMAVGDYRRAQQLAATYGAQQSGLWAFTGALLGEEITRNAPVRQRLRRSASDREEPYLALSRAVWALRTGAEVSMPPLTPHSPEAEYSSLIRAVAMLRTRNMVRHAHRALDMAQPMTPDQRVWQLAGLVHVAALGGTDLDAGHLMRQFRAALDALRTREFVVPLLRALMPEAFMLLGLLPYAHPDVEDSLAEVPLLTGEGLTHRYQVHKLPGRAAGAAVLVKAAAQGSAAQVHRQARERLNTALDALGHTSGTVNLGVALRALNVLRHAALPAERAVWEQALAQALTWVDADVLRRDLTRELLPST